jgi:hypothetical protein
MNFNTSLYSNGLGGISEEFGVSTQAARYAFVSDQDAQLADLHSDVVL